MRNVVQGSLRTAAGVLACVLLACSAGEEPSTAPPPDDGAVAPIQVVLFTHIEDNTPAGLPGSQVHRNNYLTLRARLLDVAALMQRYSVRWSLEPDWSFLVAALQYEDAGLRTSTAGLNVLRYLCDSLGAAIDPHSHEGGGYNYTDVAHLLDSLGVGGSMVIGGHIWDPALPQFQEWDRFRVPVAGRRFPEATWRGSILMGSGTPNHVNDPIISGIWRPMSRTSYFDDDPAGNIACIGAYKGDIPGISELLTLYRTRQVATKLSPHVDVARAARGDPGSRRPHHHRECDHQNAHGTARQRPCQAHGLHGFGRYVEWGVRGSRLHASRALMTDAIGLASA